MARTVGIGLQDFEKLRKSGAFYVDKTLFIKEWWEEIDDVTLITRPRRFGKTLTLSMVEHFFSVDYAGRSDLFEGLSIWKEEKWRNMQGAYPVIFLSFANVKESSYQETRNKICKLIQLIFRKFEYLLDTDVLSAEEKKEFLRVSVDMPDFEISLALQQLSGYLYRFYGKKAIILLDEYDTPMQEAYANGYWEELASFTRNLFNATFKGNSYMERGLITGITRISRESIFSDLNHLEVVTTTSDKYATCFGFTEKEVFSALDEFGLSDRKPEVKSWYDGFIFGSQRDMYNPWSILNYLDKCCFKTYWANTSDNGLAGRLIREGSPELKQNFERLMKGEDLLTPIDEQIVYNRLSTDEAAIWSLLLAGGYLKVTAVDFDDFTGKWYYHLLLTNREVRIMFSAMIESWFGKDSSSYNSFIKALLAEDLKAMNVYMNRVVLSMFSYFDAGNRPSKTTEPERFYHGFVLGLLVELEDRYVIRSNRESGFGRYDVVLEPRKKEMSAMILEFKVQDEEEAELEDTAEAALAQIREKRYAGDLIDRGFKAEKIRCYGFAFQGKRVLIRCK